MYTVGGISSWEKLLKLKATFERKLWQTFSYFLTSEFLPHKTLKETLIKYHLVITVVDPLFLSPGGIHPSQHASMATALGPSTVQVPGTPVPAGDGSSEWTPAGDQSGAGVQVRVCCVRGREEGGGCAWECNVCLLHVHVPTVYLL